MSYDNGTVVITTEGLHRLITLLGEAGYTVVGPTLREHAIVYDTLSGVEDLPAGLTDEQAGGHYRLREREDNALFGYAVGPHSWKQFLHPPQQTLWRAQRGEDTIRWGGGEDPPPRYAFLGVRACELTAIAIQDRVLNEGAYPDPHYRARREGAFLVALNCAEAGDTCFCVSMDSGPAVKGDYDLALTELLDGEHRFVLEAGSEAGQQVLERLPHRPASNNDIQASRRVVENTAASMGRSMPDTGIPALLMRNLEHPRWDDVAERCLSCANCTQVCPTCFCSDVHDENDLASGTATRTRHWDSCFNLDFSYLGGGSVRHSPRSRYRQWMTHKLATWWDQFGTSGCVGCGRCITFCPVGIDITEETWAIYQDERESP